MGLKQRGVAVVGPRFGTADPCTSGKSYESVSYGPKRRSHLLPFLGAAPYTDLTSSFAEDGGIHYNANG